MLVASVIASIAEKSRTIGLHEMKVENWSVSGRKGSSRELNNIKKIVIIVDGFVFCRGNLKELRFR